MNKIANDPGYNMKTYIQAHSPRKECILIYIQNTLVVKNIKEVDLKNGQRT